MVAFVAMLIGALLGVACGVFIVLSAVERPVWRLMVRPADSMVNDGAARLVHSELKRVIHLLPPTMGLVMGLTTALLVTQAVLRSFDARSLGVLVPFLVMLTAVVAQLGGRIRGVDSVSSQGPIEEVRHGLGMLALLHHQGLATAAAVLALQLGLVGWVN